MSKVCSVITTQVSSPIGVVRVSACSNGLHGIAQTDEINDENFRGDCNVLVTKLGGESNVIIEECLSWLKGFFAGHEGKVTNIPPLCFNGYSDFRVQVWKALTKTNRGETLSYADLSERVVGHRKASRAVGSAMRNNPFLLVVPCHRVIKSNGEIGLFSAGKRNRVKHFLIDMESN